MKRRKSFLYVDVDGIHFKDQEHTERMDISWNDMSGCSIMYKRNYGGVLTIGTKNGDYEVVLKRFFVLSNKRLLASIGYFCTLGNPTVAEELPLALGTWVYKRDMRWYNIFWFLTDSVMRWIMLTWILCFVL